MRVSFFAAAMLAIVGFQSVEAVALEGHDFDFADYELAEIDVDGDSKADVDVDAEADADSDAVSKILAKAAADAECEETVNGVTLRLSTPECV